MLLTMLFGKLMTAMVTPFYPNGEVNYDKAAELATYLADNGSDTVVVAGTTGESPALSGEEKLELFRVVTSAVKGKAKVMAGTGSNSTEQTIRLTRQAAGCDVDGIMLVVPYYNKPSQDGLFRHFSEIAQSTDLPVMLYNVPGRTSVNMSTETTLRLAKLPNVVAIKEACGDLEQIANIRAATSDQFVIYSGDDSLTLPILSIGGHGVVSVVAHIAGNEIKAMVEAFHSGNNRVALDAHLRLLPLFKAMFITSNPVPVKGALNMLGHGVGGVRLPLVDLSETQQSEVSDVLAALGYL
jgi:4-hydroxy-tetrahydrodipicolinate synthase